MEKKKAKNKIGKIIGDVLLAIFCLLIAYIVIKVVIGAITHTPTCLFNHYVLVVKTASMDPTIEVGDIVLVKRATIDVAAQNDIVSFVCIDPSQEIYGSLVVHRVISIETVDGVLQLTTRGDANPISDTYKVTADNFIGVVDHISPSLGKIYMNFVSSYLAIFMLVTVLILYVISKIVRHILKLKQEEAHKQAEEDEKEQMKQAILDEIKKEKGE